MYALWVYRQYKNDPNDMTCDAYVYVKNEMSKLIQMELFLQNIVDGIYLYSIGQFWGDYQQFPIVVSRTI